MNTEKLVKIVITWVSVIMIIMVIIFACRSCVKSYDSTPYITHVRIEDDKQFGGFKCDYDEIANIDINEEYKVRDYVVDYENKQIIINLEVKKQ